MNSECYGWYDIPDEFGINWETNWHNILKSKFIYHISPCILCKRWDTPGTMTIGLHIQDDKDGNIQTLADKQTFTWIPLNNQFPSESRFINTFLRNRYIFFDLLNIFKFWSKHFFSFDGFNLLILFDIINAFNFFWFS